MGPLSAASSTPSAVSAENRPDSLFPFAVENIAKIAATAQSLSAAWRPNPPHFDQGHARTANNMLLSDPSQLNLQMDLPSVLGSNYYSNPYGSYGRFKTRDPTK